MSFFNKNNNFEKNPIVSNDKPKLVDNKILKKIKNKKLVIKDNSYSNQFLNKFLNQFREYMINFFRDNYGIIIIIILLLILLYFRYLDVKEKREKQKLNNY